MAILLLFNERDTYSYDDIAATTQLNPDVLEQAMATILKAKVLLISPEGSKVRSGASFKLNTDFKNKKIRIKLDQGGVKETKQEEAETNKTIEEDRKILIQVIHPIHFENLEPALNVFWWRRDKY